jgi:hypothetical protein
MYDPIFMRQVALAIHHDRLRKRQRRNQIRGAARRTIFLRALAGCGRSLIGARTTPPPAACKTLPSN